MGSNRLVRKAVAVALVVAAGCATPPRRFPLAAPLWEDPDRGTLLHVPQTNPSGHKPEPESVDKMAPYWISRFWRFDVAGEAVNVNAVDEVPNSSWFTNRIGLFDISPERAARGPCGDAAPLDPRTGPWVITSGKPLGRTPGLFIDAPDGHSYLIKVDGADTPLRQTAGDVIGSRLWWLAGYNAPCNEVVHFDPGILVVGRGATTSDAHGHERPLTPDYVEAVLANAYVRADGQLRASASRILPGKSLGPFRYEGTRPDDPNDVIAHEDRRELRGMRLLAAWINHWDVKGDNTLDVVVEEAGRRFLRHYVLDWGDSLGPTVPRVGGARARRFGHSHELDFEHAVQDLLTLGLIPRPWYRSSDLHPVFGPLGNETFVPSEWRSNVPVPAFVRMTDRDRLWMARILSGITDSHLAAIVAEAALPSPDLDSYLIDALRRRRDVILAEAFVGRTALSRFHLVRRGRDGQSSLCFEDVALVHDLRPVEGTRYALTLRGGDRFARVLGSMIVAPDAAHPTWTCVPFPWDVRRPARGLPPATPDDDPRRYALLEIAHLSPVPTPPVVLHVYDLGSARGMRLVGIER